MNNEQFNALIGRYVGSDISADELKQMRSLLQEPVYQEMLAAYMEDQQGGAITDREMPDERTTMLVERFVQERLKKPRVSYIRSSWLRYAAALIIIAGTGVYFWHSTRKNTELAGNTSPHIIMPGSIGAILTLADGSTVLLDSVADGKVATQNGTQVMLKKGQLAYDGAGEGDVTYNTVSTPKGRQFQLVLADGSRVWLNAASSLRYPTSFTGKERTVQITGEAYFEVAPDSRSAFHVLLENGARVEVLGTSFNIMSYQDEKDVRTTLLSGAVKVVKQEHSLLLDPGQQVILNKAGDLKLNDGDVDTEEAVAWKNGFFMFDNTDLDVIMRQISRWYDVDVSYNAPISVKHYTGRVRNNSGVSEVLHKLELAGGVKFEIDGRKIMVKLK